MNRDAFLRRLIDAATDGRSFGDTSDDWINDPDRMARCADAAEHGADGSTHSEVIDDLRSAVDRHLRYGRTSKCYSEITRIEALIDTYFDDLETWHRDNGTLHQEVG